MAVAVDVCSLQGPVPARALSLSYLALFAALCAALLFPQGVVEHGTLVWVLSLVPAFLLSYYRGWHRVSVMLAVGMVALSSAPAVGLAVGRDLQATPLLALVIAPYIGIALGAGWYTELRASRAELQSAQWQLVQAEKLESVGRLAAGVAHEVKNPLMTIMTGVQYLSRHYGEQNEQLTGLLTDMLDAVTRADAIIRDLLDYATPRPLDRRPVQINAVVTRALALVRLDPSAAAVTVETDLSTDLPLVDMDAAAMQQVFINLFTNAMQAMTEGGTLTVRTSVGSPNTQPSASHRPRRELRVGDTAVLVEIEDSGPGIPREQLVKIFEPFFTTKPAGQGSGLGLSVSKQIVERHQGTLQIANRAAGGARVTVSLKASDQEGTRARNTDPDRRR